MTHLDEGTIHAWLDGALDAARSREIEAHVASCAQCSAAVAEARGLIAGASRILGALDDVPGGVIPRGGSAASGTLRNAAAAPPTNAARKARGPWRVTRWASGIAAVLVAGIVLSTANRADRSTEFSQAPKAVVDTAVLGASSQAPAGAALDAVKSSEAPVAERREAAFSPPPASPPAPAVSGGVASGRVAGVALTPGSAANQARKSLPAAPEPRAAERASGSLLGIGARPPAAQQDPTRMRVARADSMLELKSVAAAESRSEEASVADVSSFAGCYRLDRSYDARVGAAKGAAVAATEAPANRRRAAAPTAAAAPSAAAPQMSDLSARGLPAIVRLDTARSPLGYAVRVSPDSTVGSWRIVGDSVRVELGARRTLMLSRAQRVSCSQ